MGFTEWLGGWYVLGTALGALSGAIANFLLNRHWSFQASGGGWKRQAFRYSLVSTGSLLLNTGGVYLLTEFARLYYMVSVVIISIGVGLFFNYPLFHSYVYKREERQ